MNHPPVVARLHSHTPPAVPVTEPQVVFDVYAPPFDLTSDFLFAFAFAPTAPLQKAFPAIPFVSIANRTPLVVWVGRIRHIRYTNAGGKRQEMGGPEAILYDEINVAALLKARQLFIPAIYSSSSLAVQIGHAYGMPKSLAPVQLAQTATTFNTMLQSAEHRSYIIAERLRHSRFLRFISRRFLPRPIWKALFPSSAGVTPIIQPMRAPQWYRIREGRFDLPLPWLPNPIPFLPLGLYSPGQEMQLPPP
jgi:hypothetical protein